MPKVLTTKCWYLNCDSDNRREPDLFFYKFPRDLKRCEKWVTSCANDELTVIWKESPQKVFSFRLCQKHFLQELCGFRRLVGHACPVPYGVNLTREDADRFIAECASLDSPPTILTREQDQLLEYQFDALQPYQQQQQYSDSTFNDLGVINNFYDMSDQNHLNYGQGDLSENYYPQESNCDQQHQQHQQQQQQQQQQQVSTNLDSLMAMEPIVNHQSTNDPNQNTVDQVVNTFSENIDSIDVTGTMHYNKYVQTNNHQPDDISQQVPNQTGGEMVVCEQNDIDTQPHIDFYVDNQLQQESANTTTLSSSANERLNHQENPRINFDRQGRIVNVRYSTETVSLVNADDKERYQAHIEALKHKVSYYQRKLAVKNHRYQKIKTTARIKSKKNQLLDCLRACEADFSPFIFELFKRQIKGPSSKQGNRWSDEVKSFASNIYLRSKCAYRYVRKSIDIPSEYIVKRYITEKNLSKLPLDGLDDNEEEESNEKST